MNGIINAKVKTTENKIILAVLEEFERQLKKHNVGASDEGATALDVSHVLVTSHLSYTFQDDKKAMHEIIDMHAGAMKESVDIFADMVFSHGTIH